MTGGLAADHCYKFYLVDLEDGSLVIPGDWMTANRKYAAWPPEASQMSSLAYDKFIQTSPIEPQGNWELVKIVKIRAFSDEFSKVRLKLKTAEDCSDTDLNSEKEDSSGSRRVLRKGNRKPCITFQKSSAIESDTENEPGLADMTNLTLPKVPSIFREKPLHVKDLFGNNLESTQETGSSDRSTDTKVLSSSMNFHFKIQEKSEAKIEVQRKNELLNKLREKVDLNKVASKEIVNQSSLQQKVDPQIATKEIVNFHLVNQAKTDTAKKTYGDLFKPTINSNNKVDPKAMMGSEKFVKPKCNAQEIPTLVKFSKAQNTSQETAGDLHDHEESHNSKSSGPEIGSSCRSRALELASKLSDLDFKAYLILNLTEVRQQLKELSTKVAHCQRVHVQQHQPTVAPTDAELANLDEVSPFDGLPALDKETWDNFNMQLRTDKKFAHAVALKLRDVCSAQSNFGDVVRLALSVVISNSLASEYSWAGKRKKLPFGSEYFIKFLNWILKNYFKFPRKSDDLKTIVANWLRLAQQRSGGANFRSYRKQNNDADENKSADSPNAKTSTPRKKVISTKLATKRLSSNGKKSSTPTSSPRKTVDSPVTSPVHKKSRGNRITISDDDDDEVNSFMKASDETHETEDEKDEAGSDGGDGFILDEAECSYESLH